MQTLQPEVLTGAVAAVEPQSMAHIAGEAQLGVQGANPESETLRELHEAFSRVVRDIDETYATLSDVERMALRGPVMRKCDGPGDKPRQQSLQYPLI